MFFSLLFFFPGGCRPVSGLWLSIIEKWSAITNDDELICWKGWKPLIRYTRVKFSIHTIFHFFFSFFRHMFPFHQLYLLKLYQACILNTKLPTQTHSHPRNENKKILQCSAECCRVDESANERTSRNKNTSLNCGKIQKSCCKSVGASARSLVRALTPDPNANSKHAPTSRNMLARCLRSN